MKSPLTLQRLFLGLNGMAIEGKELNITVKPEFNKSGNLVCTKWNLAIQNDTDENDEPIVVKDYLAGYKIDNDDFNVPMKFYDASGRFPRLIADRISTMQQNNTERRGKAKSHSTSAFSNLLEIVKDYYDYIDDEMISIFQNVKIMKMKCNLSYPLLIEIPDTVQTNEELLKHFYSLGLVTLKNMEIEEINSQLNELMNTIDMEMIDRIRKDYLARNKIRYWKKALTLKNGKRYWLSNHIFMNSIIPFKELLIDLTGVEIVSKGSANENLVFAEQDNTKSSTSTNTGSSFVEQDVSKSSVLEVQRMKEKVFVEQNNTNEIQDNTNKKIISTEQAETSKNETNKNALDNLINTKFGFGL